MRKFIYIAGLVGILMVLPPSQRYMLAALSDNLLACWKFDSGGLTTDSHDGHTLTNNGSIVSAAGKINESADITGAGQYFSVADHADWNFSTDFTVVGWVWFDDLSTAQHGIIGQSSFGVDGGWIIQLTNDASPILEMYIQTAAGDASNKCFSAGGEISSTGTWYQIAGVYDGSLAAADRCKVYVNSSEVTFSSAGTIPATLLNPTSDFEIGRWAGLRNYDGRVDNWAVWNRPLTDSEITTDLYNSGAGTACPIAAPAGGNCWLGLLGIGKC